MLILCLGPSRVPFLRPAARVLSSQLVQSAVPAPPSAPLWIPSAFPTGPSGADLLAHSRVGRSPSGVLPLIPQPRVPLQVASLIPLLCPVLGSPCPPAAFFGPLLIQLSPSLVGSPRSPQSPSEFTPHPAVPVPILVLSFSRGPSRGPLLTPRPGPPAHW